MTRVGLEWGLVGAGDPDCAVVVDVLSFTTTVSVALDHGAEVLPLPWQHESAAAFAREQRATLALGRRAAVAGGGVSLSPTSVREAAALERLVLPSPNGSAISHRLATTGCTVVAACLRNAGAVAGWISEQRPATVAVIAAGERRADGSLRPALEDLLGSGAVLDGLADDMELTPDAQAARAAFRDARDDLLDRLLGCPSGEELVAGGFRRDVEVAAELDSSAVVPVLADGAFRPG